MSQTTSTLRATGASITTTVPKEIVERLGLQPGQSVAWVPQGDGSVRLVPVDPAQAALRQSAEVIMERYASVFERLAREEH
jgi:antitoxin component of MazEF toxin-antitoxin module